MPYPRARFCAPGKLGATRTKHLVSGFAGTETIYTATHPGRGGGDLLAPHEGEAEASGGRNEVPRDVGAPFASEGRSSLRRFFSGQVVHQSLYDETD